MSDNLVTVATFNSPAEAVLAKNQLEAEGIRAFLIDEESINMLWLLGTALGGVKLQVSEDQWEQADQILQERMAEPVDEEAAKEDWREECGEEGISTPAEETWEPESIKTTEGEGVASRAWLAAVFGLFVVAFYMGVTTILHDPFSLFFRGLFASRLSFRFLIVIAPVFIAVSIWHLIRLSTWKGELSSTGKRKFVAAFIIDILLIPVWTILLRRFL